MTLAERKHAAELCRANWPGKVVVGISSTAVADCVELLDHASSQITTGNVSIHFTTLRTQTPTHRLHACMLLDTCGGFVARNVLKTTPALLYIEMLCCCESPLSELTALLPSTAGSIYGFNARHKLQF